MLHTETVTPQPIGGCCSVYTSEVLSVRAELVVTVNESDNHATAPFTRCINQSNAPLHFRGGRRRLPLLLGRRWQDGRRGLRGRRGHDAAVVVVAEHGGTVDDGTEGPLLLAQRPAAHAALAGALKGGKSSWERGRERERGGRQADRATPRKPCFPTPSEFVALKPVKLLRPLTDLRKVGRDENKTPFSCIVLLLRST